MRSGISGQAIILTRRARPPPDGADESLIGCPRAWIGEIVELPAERQTRLYSAMPLYEGQMLLAKPAIASRRSLYDRDPLVFWKSLSAGLTVLVILLLAWSARH